MLDIDFFRNPRFSAASAAITLTFMALMGVIFGLTQYLQSVQGFSPLEAGAVLLPMSAVMMVMAPTSAHIVEWVGTKLVLGTGLLIVAVALTLQSLLQVDTATVVIILMSMLLGLGMSNVMAPATESIMGSLPRAKAGVGSAVNDTTRQMGGALGVALIGSLLSTRYQSDVDAGLGGARNVSSELLDHVGANVQAGVNIGRGTPAPLGDRIVDVAHHAFLSGYHLAVLVAAGITLLAAIGVFRWLPARAATPTEAPAPDEARADGDEAQGLEPAIEGATSG
jgi:predicted MFS family arabinose efflux permease